MTSAYTKSRKYPPPTREYLRDIPRKPRGTSSGELVGGGTLWDQMGVMKVVPHGYCLLDIPSNANDTYYGLYVTIGHSKDMLDEKSIEKCEIIPKSLQNHRQIHSKITPKSFRNQKSLLNHSKITPESLQNHSKITLKSPKFTPKSF